MSLVILISLHVINPVRLQRLILENPVNNHREECNITENVVYRIKKRNRIHLNYVTECRNLFPLFMAMGKVELCLRHRTCYCGMLTRRGN